MHTGTLRARAGGVNGDLSALDNFMLSARGNPLCTVRNRGAFIVFNKTLHAAPQVFVYEKQYESTVDLTMGMVDATGRLTHGGMITE